MVRKVKNPDTCPAHLLPWLACKFAVDSWEEAWTEDEPHKDPYTFRVKVYSLQAIDEVMYQRIRRQVDKAKNLRSLLTTIDVIADMGAKENYYIGGAVTAWIDVVIEAGV
ncbi:phage tail protein I [Enterobacter sp. UPMP2052]